MTVNKLGIEMSCECRTWPGDRHPDGHHTECLHAVSPVAAGGKPLKYDLKLSRLTDEVWAMERRMGQIHRQLREDGHAFAMTAAYSAGEALHALAVQLDEDKFGGDTSPIVPANTGEAWRP